MPLERPTWPLPRIGEVLRHAGGHYFANAIGGFLFAVTGPAAIILAVAGTAGLDKEIVSAWLCTAYTFSGVLSIATSLLFRQPLPISYSIPAVVVVGPALQAFPFSVVVGAYVATGALILALALSGLLRRVSAALPMPIVMAMVAGVFLPFGVRLVEAFDRALWPAAATVAAYLLFGTVGRLQRFLPPILAALLAGLAATWATGGFGPAGQVGFALATPILWTPAFDWRAIAELVIPLAVTVVGIHNPQGYAILRNAGYEPPETLINLICGAGSIVYGAFGSVPIVMTGPVNAILNSSGERSRRYIAALWLGVFFFAFGIFSPAAVALALAIPGTLIGVLAGLAMVPVLQSAFIAGFRGPFATGALVTFLVTVAGVSIFNIGGAFWGLVFGYAVSRLVEREDFRALEAGD